MKSILAAVVAITSAYKSELLPPEQAKAMGVVWRGNKSNSHDKLSLKDSEIPKEFNWCNFDGKGKDGTNYCTVSRNQHIPQYCGACWAFGTLSAFADRIKIARKAQGPEIIPSPQHLLNCGTVGGCDGGYLDGTYQWIYDISERTGTGIGYESAQPYMACSKYSTDGICKGQDWSCTPLNTARTCGDDDEEGGGCHGLAYYPNATISDYGSVYGRRAMQREIFARGPIACEIAGDSLLAWESGVIEEYTGWTNHVISVVGWGVDAEKGNYWWVRNSWGEFWGDMGYVRVGFGELMIEYHCVWAEPGVFTAREFDNQVHCHNSGSNCQKRTATRQEPKTIVF